MHLHIGSSYNNISAAAYADMILFIGEKQVPLICTTSGDSPKGLYRQIIDNSLSGAINTNQWHYIGLDEWLGMNGDNEGSCRWHLDQSLYKPLQVADDKLCFFNGKNEAADECQKAENFVASNGGIDVAIIGLGTNGHIGMNEPGTPAALRSHLAEIAESTQQIGQKYFANPTSLTHGITLGIANLPEARHIILLVSGSSKATAVKQMMEEEPTTSFPVSLLKTHPNFYVYVDEQAAAFINK